MIHFAFSNGARLLTLSEAAAIFGYTSDHLAYLCRRGFVRAERHGRTWLTTEGAISDYRSALSLAGRPVSYEQQNLVLARISPVGAAPVPAQLTGFFTPRIGLSAPRYGLIRDFRRLLAKQINLVQKDINAFESAIVSAGKSWLKNLSKNRALRPHAAEFGFAFAQTPRNLPTAITLPEYLQPVRRAEEFAVAAALSALLIFAAVTHLSGPPQSRIYTAQGPVEFAITDFSSRPEELFSSNIPAQAVAGVVSADVVFSSAQPGRSSFLNSASQVLEAFRLPAYSSPVSQIPNFTRSDTAVHTQVSAAAAMTENLLKPEYCEFSGYWQRVCAPLVEYHGPPGYTETVSVRFIK